MILTLPDRAERRRIAKKMHKTKDKASIAEQKQSRLSWIITSFTRVKKTQGWLEKNPKFILLFQPVYSPWVNKIEKLWHALHETVTRNHQCKAMWQLLKRVRNFMDNVSPFPGGGHGVQKVKHN